MTTDLLAEFRVLAKPNRLKCGIELVLAALEPADAAKLAAALDADWVRHSDIARWLASREHRVTAQTVARHRKRECSCD